MLVMLFRFLPSLAKNPVSEHRTGEGGPTYRWHRVTENVSEMINPQFDGGGADLELPINLIIRGGAR
jgi:hypothetical protein